VYDIVYRAGRDLGMKRLGWRSYMVNHVEGGFAQGLGTFLYSGITDPRYMGMFPPAMAVAMTECSGSIDPADVRPSSAPR
jgi:hypothetical protein